jgi:hypothetical protein
MLPSPRRVTGAPLASTIGSVRRDWRVQGRSKVKVTGEFRNMSLRLRLVAASACAILGSSLVAPCGDAAAPAAAPAPDPIAGLTGRWSGQGTVIPARGSGESFKCVVTYAGNRNSSQVLQNLRCQSANYKLDTATHLLIRGKHVTGRWQEKVFSLDGTVTGKVTPDGFDVVLSGRFFTAKMTIAISQCEQSVTVTPARADYIRQMSASLKKLNSKADCAARHAVDKAKREVAAGSDSRSLPTVF